MNNVQAGGVGLQQRGVWIPGAEGIHTVEGVLCATVPEVAIVKDRVDHRGSIPRRGSTNVQRSAGRIGDGPNWIGDGGFVFRAETEDHVIEIVPQNALRSDDIVIVRKHGGIGARNIGQLVQWEIANAELMVGPKSWMENSGI